MKQNILKSHFLAAACAVAAIAPATAADVASAATHSPADTNQVTLDDLVKEASEKNQELRFYEAEIQAAKAGRKAAGLPANPELSAGVGRKMVRGSSLSAEGVAGAVSVVQPFEWPRRLGLRNCSTRRGKHLRPRRTLNCSPACRR